MEGRNPVSLLHVYDDREYDLNLEAFGRGVLEDANFGYSLEEILRSFRLEHGRDPIDVSYVIEDTQAYDLDYWFTAVAPGYLEPLSTLKELVLPASVESVGMTPGLEKLLKGNRTLIRGAFDSYAEEFAEALCLPFRPADFVIARYFLKNGLVVAAVSPVINAGRDVYRDFGQALLHTEKEDSAYTAAGALAELKTTGGVLLAFGLGSESTMVGVAQGGLDSAPYAEYPLRRYYRQYILLVRVNRWRGGVPTAEFAGVLDPCGNTIRTARIQAK